MLENNQPQFETSSQSQAVNPNLQSSLNRIQKRSTPPTVAPARTSSHVVKHGEDFERPLRRDSHESHVYQLVLRTLAKASNSAKACNRDEWAFAVEINELTKVGVSKYLLRVMVCDGAIEHCREVTETGQGQRTFEPENDVVLSDRSCFVISEYGKKLLAGHSLAETELPMKQNRQNGSQTIDIISDSVPIWDTKNRELRLGSILVKRFKWPAANQEQILQAFQEEGWPAQIDDPLPPDPRICPKRRLHDTIKCLNRRQVNGAIKFRGDGTGQGVLLEINGNKLKGQNTY